MHYTQEKNHSRNSLKGLILGFCSFDIGIDFRSITSFNLFRILQWNNSCKRNRIRMSWFCSSIQHRYNYYNKSRISWTYFRYVWIQYLKQLLWQNDNQNLNLYVGYNRSLDLHWRPARRQLWLFRKALQTRFDRFYLDRNEEQPQSRQEQSRGLPGSRWGRRLQINLLFCTNIKNFNNLWMVPCFLFLFGGSLELTSLFQELKAFYCQIHNNMVRGSSFLSLLVLFCS